MESNAETKAEVLAYGRLINGAASVQHATLGHLAGGGADLGKAEGLEPALMYCLRAIWDIFGVDIIHGPNTIQDGY